MNTILFGYVAEFKLQQYIARNESITSMTKDDDHDRKKKGDLRITYRGREFIIVCSPTTSVEPLPYSLPGAFGPAPCIR